MIIATRQLTAICKSGAKKPVVLRLESPIQEDGMWRCWYEIEFPEDGWPAQTRRSYAGGTDAMDAIQIGLMKIGTELHFTSYHREHKLFWDEGQEGSSGLIVPKNARDLLRGDDVTYYGS